MRAFLSPHLVATFRASKPDYFHQLLNEALDTGSGEGPDVGVIGRKTLVGGAKAAALVKTYIVHRSPGNLLWSFLNASLLLWVLTFFS